MVNLDWNNLGFTYIKTPYNVRCEFKDGKWGDIEIHTEDTYNISIAASALHYSQEAFEGLKAYRGKDGKIRLFRVDENAKRMAQSADYLKMAAPPIDLFCKAVEKVVALNAEYVPPCDTNASLYIRPVLFGTTAQVGVKPANDYVLIIFVTPVGAYFKGLTPAPVVVMRKFDRAAPQGTGHIKAGGNYGASLTPYVEGHEKGYGSVLYLDPKEKKYIDECGAANFFAIRGNSYITPKSPSVLNSITNMSLVSLAEEMGLKIERRPVAFEEISTFEEAAACGTAAVISPISEVYDYDNDVKYTFGETAGPWCQKLYDRLNAIQRGDSPDTFGWVTIINEK